MLKGARLIVALLALAPGARAAAEDEPLPAPEAPHVETVQAAAEPPDLVPDVDSVEAAPESAVNSAPSPLKLAAPPPAARRPPLTGDHLRYGKLWLIPRGILSGIGIPASMPTWSAQEVARFAAVTLTVTSLMLPAGPSADVRIQRAMHDVRSPGLDRLFPKIYTIPMTIGLGVYTTALSAGFFFFKRPKLREYVSLMLEALGITQFYHVALKLMIGREGPYQGAREGQVHGPGRVSFPGGTPSGHAASAFAVLVTAAEYYGGWPLKVVCYLASVYLATSFFYNNQHFLSDVIWGAAIGDTVAKWVVRHRSSDARPSRRKTKVMLSPVALPGGGGLRLSLTGGSFL